MTTRNQRVSADEQYQLILECRSSGLSDYQWCMEHGIKPGTFYNWVKRLRQKACYEIPASACRNDYHRDDPQEVVPVEIVPESMASVHEADLQPHTASLPVLPATDAFESAPIRIRIGSAMIGITNDVDPRLLMQILRFSGEH